MLAQWELHDLLSLKSKDGCSPNGEGPCFGGNTVRKFVIRSGCIIGIRICRFLVRGGSRFHLGLLDRFLCGLLGFLPGSFLGCVLGNFVLLGRPLGEGIVLHEAGLATQEHK